MDIDLLMWHLSRVLLRAMNQRASNLLRVGLCTFHCNVEIEMANSEPGTRTWLLADGLVKMQSHPPDACTHARMHTRITRDGRRTSAQVIILARRGSCQVYLLPYMNNAFLPDLPGYSRQHDLSLQGIRCRPMSIVILKSHFRLQANSELGKVQEGLSAG